MECEVPLFDDLKDTKFKVDATNSAKNIKTLSSEDQLDEKFDINSPKINEIPSSNSYFPNVFQDTL